MKFLFSRRHKKALENKSLKVSIPGPLRRSIWEIIASYNQSWYETTDTGWNYNTSHFEVTEKDLVKHWWSTIKAYDDEDHLKTSDFQGLFIRGFNLLLP
jgi:hypothetical protein